MQRSSGIVILSLFAAIYASDIKIVYKSSTKPEDISLLQSIRADQALPIILFEYGTEGTQLQRPIALAQAKIRIEDGVLLYGTEFVSLLPDVPIHFCPKQDPKNHCLAPQDFDEDEPLRCEREPEIVLEKDPDKIGTQCGSSAVNQSLRFVYKLCRSIYPYKYDKTASPFLYSFCYNDSLEKNLYTMHKISMPLLLTEELLIKEREIKFDYIDKKYNYIKSNFEKFKAAVTKKETPYTLQPMVPLDDFAFATMRKSTYHYVNMEFQHEKLIPLWDEINDHIRADAINWFTFTRTIYTTVFDIPKNEISATTNDKEQNQFFNIWIKVILDLNVVPYKGVAILLNNFITTENDNEYYKHIETFCVQSLCADSLNQKVIDRGSQVLCCEINPKIRQLFDLDEPVFSFHVLSIHNVIKI